MNNDPKTGQATWTVKYRVQQLPREGNRFEEYEDACAISVTDSLPVRAALADGATESAFSGAWAQKITSGFVTAESGTSYDLEQNIARWHLEWKKENRRVNEDLPWYTVAKMEEGAFAAFLGITILADGSWQAQAIGDCCLFCLRNDHLIKSWPYELPDQFTSRPDLLSSISGRTQPEILQVKDIWTPGDTFILASDAIAAWLLRWGEYDVIHDSDTQFRERIDVARSKRRLRNDDVTLLVLTISEGARPGIT